MNRKKTNMPTSDNRSRLPQTQQIPTAVLHRLPRYYRCLRWLIGSDVLRVRSSELAQLLGVSATQIRQDLHFFGGFGQQGYGYNVKDLYSEIGAILGVRQNYAVIIWGDHGTGTAVSRLPFFSLREISLRAVFDTVGAEKIEQTTKYPVFPEEQLEEYCRAHPVDLLILCTSRHTTVQCRETVKKIAPKGIWNLTGIPMSFDGIIQHEFTPADDFLALCCDVFQTQQKADRQARENQERNPTSGKGGTPT